MSNSNSISITLHCSGGDEHTPPNLKGVQAGNTTITPVDGKYVIEFADGAYPEGGDSYDSFVIEAVDSSGTRGIYKLFFPEAEYSSALIPGWMESGKAADYTVFVTNPHEGPPLDPKLVIRNVSQPSAPTRNPSNSGSFSLWVTAPGITSGYLGKDDDGHVIVVDSHEAALVLAQDFNPNSTVYQLRAGTSELLVGDQATQKMVVLRKDGWFTASLFQDMNGSTPQLRQVQYARSAMYVDPKSLSVYYCEADFAASNGLVQVVGVTPTAVPPS